MGMFGDRSRKVVSNQSDLQAMELDLFRMQMQKIAREDAQKMAIMREALGITESLRTPEQVAENIQRAQGRGDTTTMVDVTGTPQGQLSNPEPLFEMARQIRQPEIQEDELPLISIGDATVVESQSAPEMPMPSSPVPAVEAQTEAPAEPQQTSSLVDTAREQLKIHEGYKPYPYKDSLGKWTIGVGHLIGDGTDEALENSPYKQYSESNPMPDSEVQELFQKDYDKHAAIAEKYPAYETMNDTGKLALIDMSFNMGDLREGWPNTLKLLEEGRYEEAATIIENSKYARQVGNRAKTIASQIRAAGD